MYNKYLHHMYNVYKQNGNSIYSLKQLFDRFIPLSHSISPGERKVLSVHHDLELVLIHWKPFQQSPIHNHPNGGCLYRVLYGNMIEEFHHKSSVCIRPLNGTMFIQNPDTHLVKNLDRESLSVHLYSHAGKN